jgi:hypothetical protein
MLPRTIYGAKTLLHPSQDAVRVHFTPFPDLLESKSVMRSRLRRETLAPEIVQKVLVYQVQSDWAAEISLAARSAGSYWRSLATRASGLPVAGSLDRGLCDLTSISVSRERRRAKGCPVCRCGGFRLAAR